jgi:hypothetical protein
MCQYTPVNQRPRETSEIDNDVDYAIRLAESYLAQIRRFGLDVQRAKVLELGPGINFGPQLILASYGAHVTVADPYLAPWSDDYHREFYRRLRARWSGEAGALDRVITANAYLRDLIETITEPAENLKSIQTASIDCVFSNAVLEHVYNLPKVSQELARITKLSGVNSHQIDFRHHADFSRPLEFLLSKEIDFRTNFRRNCGEQGNRWRPSEAHVLFEMAGFEVMRIEPTHWAEDSYLQDFIGRLRSTTCRYRNWPAEDLKVISARFELRRVNGVSLRLRAALRYARSELRKVGAGGWDNIGHEISFSQVTKKLAWRLRPIYKAELRNYQPENGYCWLASVAEHIPSDNGDTSTLELYEDGRLLGPAHAAHVDIRRFGGGRYSHWGAHLYFSTSDNTHPGTNGRRYVVVEKRV